MPLYTKDSLETLKQRLDLIEVISGEIDLKKMGVVHKGHCPFHEEKTPSFTVRRGDTHYHCYGCGAHGDAIQFLMQLHSLSFTEAVTSLAERFQVSLHYETAGVDQERESSQQLRAALESAKDFFHMYLLHSEEGHQALAYLFQRGFTLETLSRFEIGFAPAKRGLFLKIMKQQGFPEEILSEVGLLSAERKSEFFRERITFPILNPFGRTIGFSARKYLESTFGGKYINTSETPLFKKSRTLFGLYHSRRRIAKQRRALIVEGQIDCLKLIDVGLNLAVAPLGTAFAEGHVKELLSLGVREVVLLFDSDIAGEKAASKTGDLLLKEGVEVHVAQLPVGSDPDLFIRTKGVPALIERLENAVDYLVFQINFLSKEFSLQTAAGKSALVKQLKEQIEAWGDPILVHESLKKVAKLIEIPESMLGIQPQLKRASSSNRLKIDTLPPIDPHRILEIDLLRWWLLIKETRSDYLSWILRHLTEEHLWVPICRQIFKTLSEQHRQGISSDLLALITSVDAEEGQKCLEEIYAKKVNMERAKIGIAETLHKIHEREWMRRREEIKNQMSNTQLKPEELSQFTRAFDALKRPQIETFSDG